MIRRKSGDIDKSCSGGRADRRRWTLWSADRSADPISSKGIMHMTDASARWYKSDGLTKRAAARGSDMESWTILIADDDRDVHAVTELVLGDTVFDGRPLRFLQAFSAEETVRIVGDVPDIALILLDVVMETDDAGLRACRSIREDLGNRTVRIVLRTGQPGAVPESEVIRRYDINDYKEKTELTTLKMETTIFAALRSYRDIVGLERYRTALAATIEAAAAAEFAAGFDRVASGLLDQASALAEAGGSGAAALRGVAIDRLGDLARGALASQPKRRRIGAGVDFAGRGNAGPRPGDGWVDPDGSLDRVRRLTALLAQHHGHPDGAERPRADLAAVAAVAAAFEALVGGPAPVDPAEALGRIREGRGRVFDAPAVDALAARLVEAIASRDAMRNA
jgi:CheY-like chemotaxis protein